MSERDTTAQKFFDVIGEADDSRVRRIYFAAGDRTLTSMVRGDMAGSSRPDHTTAFGEYFGILAATHNLELADMDYVVRECEDMVADKYGLKIGRPV